MSCIEQLEIKHALAIELVKAFAQREDLAPSDIVGMAFHTAGLVVNEITAEAEAVMAQCKCDQQQEQVAVQDELARILDSFFKSTQRSQV
jgi:hypothetical protein